MRRHLDLVALATVADVVPLLDENRGLATAGLLALAATRRPGLQELMRSAGVDPAAVDVGARPQEVAIARRQLVASHDRF